MGKINTPSEKKKKNKENLSAKQSPGHALQHSNSKFPNLPNQSQISGLRANISPRLTISEKKPDEKRENKKSPLKNKVN